MSIRHSKNAPQRFASEVGPALVEYSNQSTMGIVTDINKAKEAIVARSDDERFEFLGKNGFTAKQAKRVIDTVVREEETKPESIWDFVQGITAMARDIKHTDERLDMEKVAGRLMSKAIH